MKRFLALAVVAVASVACISSANAFDFRIGLNVGRPGLYPNRAPVVTYDRFDRYNQFDRGGCVDPYGRYDRYDPYRRGGGNFDPYRGRGGYDRFDGRRDHDHDHDGRSDRGRVDTGRRNTPPGRSGYAPVSRFNPSTFGRN